MSAFRSTVFQIIVLVAAGMLALTAAVVVNAASPAIKVPDEAAPGQTITVQGTAFHNNQSGNLTYNGGVVTTFRASSSGTFSRQFTIPSKAKVGTGRISAKTYNGTLIATTTLEIVSTTPNALSASPTPKPSVAASPSASAAASASSSPTPSASATLSPTPAPPAVSVPNWTHVYVIMFENHEYSSIVGSSGAPYINSLIAKYGLATSYYAIGHPSEPNYIALTSGGTQGVTDDGTYNLSANNVFKQVEASGRTWHAWEQSYPGNCYTGSSSSSVVDGPGLAGSYVRKHDPAISYTSISGNATECGHITGLAGFNPGAANFNFIVPNLINDMHDGSIADGDNFLKAFLPSILGSSSFANSAVFVTFDEGTSNTNGGGHVVTIPIVSGMPATLQSATYNHYSLLRTMEQAWGLPYLGAAGSAATMNFPW